MRKEPVPHSLVEITWEDAETSSDWKTSDDIESWMESSDQWEMVRTVGYLVWSDDKHLLIAGTACWQEEDLRWHYSNFMMIPVGMVRDKRVLVPAPKVKRAA